MPRFKPDKPSLQWQLSFDNDWPTSVVFLGSSNRIAAANRRGHILIWDLPSEANEEQIKLAKEIKRDAPSVNPSMQLLGHTGGVTRLRATRDGKTLISASLDRTVRLWDPTATPNGEGDTILDLGARIEKARRTKGDENAKDAILDAPGVKIPTFNQSKVLEGHTDWINGLDLSRDENTLVTGDDDTNVKIWNMDSLKQMSSWKGHELAWVSTACLSADGKTAFIGEYSATRGSFDRPPAQARLYDTGEGKEKVDILKVQFPKVTKRDNSYGYAQTWGKFVKRGFVCSQFSPDGKMLAVGQGGETGTGQFHLINTVDGKLIKTVGGHKGGACDVRFTDEGKYLLTAGRDTTVRIVQIDNGKEVLTMGKSRGGQFKDWTHCVGISPDQQWIAAADIAGIIQVWKLG